MGPSPGSAAGPVPLLLPPPGGGISPMVRVLHRGGAVLARLSLPAEFREGPRIVRCLSLGFSFCRFMLLE